jgi:transcriptional regulator with XRE-family HTH domain
MDQKLLYQQIGLLIREQRKRHNFTQDHIAKQINMSRAAIANIEAGRQQLLVHQLYGIAKALEIEFTSLIPPPKSEREVLHPDKVRLPDDLTNTQREQILRLIRSAAP